MRVRQTPGVMHTPNVIGGCSGELQGLTTNVESLKWRSGISLSSWNSATLYYVCQYSSQEALHVGSIHTLINGHPCDLNHDKSLV